MPLYIFSCVECKFEEEKFVHKILSDETFDCPKCSGKMSRQDSFAYMPTKPGHDQFSFGQRPWRKGLDVIQQAAVLNGDMKAK